MVSRSDVALLGIMFLVACSPFLLDILVCRDSTSIMTKIVFTEGLLID